MTRSPLVTAPSTTFSKQMTPLHQPHYQLHLKPTCTPSLSWRAHLCSASRLHVHHATLSVYHSTKLVTADHRSNIWDMTHQCWAQEIHLAHSKSMLVAGKHACVSIRAMKASLGCGCKRQQTCTHRGKHQKAASAEVHWDRPLEEGPAV